MEYESHLFETDDGADAVPRHTNKWQNVCSNLQGGERHEELALTIKHVFL